MFEKNNINLDDTLAVKFYKKSVLNKIKTNKEGRKVFEDVDYVSIKVPFDSTTKVDKPVTDQIKERFRSRWERYVEKNTNKAIGTPLDLLTFLSPAQIDNLRSQSVDTIEQLANLTESAIKNIINGRDLVNQAKKFLAGENYVNQLEKQIDDLKKEIEQLKSKKKTRKKKDDVIIDNSEC